MRTRRILTGALMVFIIIASLCGCGGKDNGPTSDSKKSRAGEKLNISDVRPELIYGDYTVDMENFMALPSDYVAFMDGMELMEYDNDGTILNMSCLPMSFTAGRYGYMSEEGTGFYESNYPDADEIQKVCDSLMEKYGEEGIEYFQNYKNMLDAPYMAAKYVIVDNPDEEFDPQNAKIGTLKAFYTISGNTVTMYEEEPDPETYELKFEKPVASFDFDFMGSLCLEVRNKNSKVEMPARKYSGAYYVKSDLVDGYIGDAKDALNNIIHIHKVGNLSTEIVFADGRSTKGTKFDLNEDGTFKISWDGIRDGLVEVEETPGEIEGKFVCAEDSGIILLVDGKTYYYTCNEEDYFGNIFASIDFENLQDDEITQIVTTQVNIKNDLIDAFDKAGIAATIDERTGEVVADDSILFGVDEAIVSDEGKAYLDSFIEVYSNVIMPYVDQGYIAEITVEGHTDTSGTYDHNLDLSQNRAKAVADYCIEQQSAVKDLISAKGFAFDYPIFDGAGKVDMKASRRVVFSFKMGTGK